jgi:hypothetical protein
MGSLCQSVGAFFKLGVTLITQAYLHLLSCYFHLKPTHSKCPRPSVSCWARLDLLSVLRSHLTQMLPWSSWDQRGTCAGLAAQVKCCLYGSHFCGNVFKFSHNKKLCFKRKALVSFGIRAAGVNSILGQESLTVIQWFCHRRSRSWVTGREQCSMGVLA